MSTTSKVGVVMGTAQMGPSKSYETPDQLSTLFEVLTKHNIKELDTAQLYTGSEELLGKAGAGSDFIISTKAFGGFKAGTLKPELAVPAADESLKKLKVKQVDILYIHAPDSSIEMAEYLPGIQKIYENGVFRRFGLSNFQAKDVEAVYSYCKEHNYILPSVYQGNYSAVARKQESLLFPTLHKLNMAFYAYSPIAGGFLTKTSQQVLDGAGRFEKKPGASMYADMYAKKSLLEALDIWGELAESEGIHRGEMAYRWIRFHSGLDAARGDNIIIGARSPKDVDTTLTWLEGGPLSEKCVQGIDKMWNTIEEGGEAPLDNYHR